MDKTVGRDKRLKDKRHKKPPPVKPSPGRPNKPQKEVPTSAPLIVCDDPYSRRQIESNWNSGKNLPSSEGSDSEDEQLRAADFEKLLQMPPSVSGHFFLSTEKHWVSENEEKPVFSSTDAQQYFQIDTKLLISGLATIPFYERNDYPIHIFSKQELDSMKLKAHYESKNYDELCQRLELIDNMGDKQQTPKQPIKCLIGANALPPTVERSLVEPETVPSQPVPCLIGPMSLPPELRSNTNTTGDAPATNPGHITERLGAVKISIGDTVPIGSGDSQAGLPTTSEETKRNDNAAQDKTKATGKDTKEDIQQWLDDILDM